MKTAKKIIISTVPLFIIVMLSPLTWGLIYAFVVDIRWQVALGTIWIFGGMWVGSYYHAKGLDEEMNKEK